MEGIRRRRRWRRRKRFSRFDGFIKWKMERRMGVGCVGFNGFNGIDTKEGAGEPNKRITIEDKRRAGLALRFKIMVELDLVIYIVNYIYNFM